ncbi:Protein cramped-like [Mytilus coruscus]|uniref:Protein cramped-like n=1 Tax=Mytilus coruscus TaxID=42192 RepID=A0A6J7ZWQ3_MYTCO|nr:Protein cramped-like [Mytilus coruscus]
MPMTKRRKTEQGEGNSTEKEKEKNRTTSDNKDAVKEDKQSKGDHRSETNDRKHPQTGRQDSSQQPQDTQPKVPRIGAVTRSRVVRKPKRDLSPPPSPTKKPAKETKTNTPETKQKRQWELWSIDDKDAFFDGLFEVGKDFDGIQTLIAQKSKKKGVTPALVKNKDQVRHFYYRTWHKISKFITLTQDVKKESQEIYGLINYGVLRKRIKGMTTSDNKDAVKEDKQSKGDHRSETNDRKHPQTGRQDSSQQPQDTQPKVPRIGAVTRSRVVRKPKRDLSPPPSPTKKPAKRDKDKYSETKQKRQWELWSIDDKGAFFDGLTWHKISKFITLTQDVKKESQEIYGLINYGVLRKRIKGLNEKTGAKLNDLVHNGFTTVKIRGKNLRIKTPICLALKKLNNIDTTEHKCNAADRIPNKIHVEMNPKTNATWNMIQDMAFNPRLKLMLKPNRTLSSVITYLSQKWKSHRLKLKENVPGAETEPVPVLTVYPHPDCDITPLTLQATKEPKINITFSDYRENMQLMNSPLISKDKKGECTKTSSTVFSENSHSVDFMDPKNGMFESPKSRGTVKGNKTGMTPSSSMSCSVYSNDAAFLSEGENAMFPDTPLSRNNSKSTENLTETDSTDGTPPRKKHMSGGTESEVVKSSDNEDKSEKEDQESLNIKEAFEKGWTSTSAENLTIAQLFLMIGKDNKIRLEYDFCKESTIEDIVKTQLTNTLRRLVHLAVMEMTDVKGSSSSSSPCHTCGAVRAKATKGCGVKGQRAVGKNPLSSRSGSGDGLVDAGTQTTFEGKQMTPINSSQGKEAVFKVPVAGTAFLQRNTLPPGSVPASRSLNQAFNVLGPGYKSGRKIRQINRKPMVVQRTILPKAPNYFLVQPNGQNLKTVINVPNSIPILSNVSTAPPACTTVKTVQLDVQSHSQTTLTLNPSHLEVQSQTLTPSQMNVQNHGSSQLNVQNLGPGQLNVHNPGPGQVNIRNPGPNQLNVQNPRPLQTIMMGPGHLPVKINHVNSTEITASSLEITAGTTVNIYTSAATSNNDVITTASTVQGSLSPPSISNLLDMSFSGFGTPGSDGEKLFEMALENGSSFEPLLDESANKETAQDRTLNKTEPVKAIFRSPVCTSSWMNGEVGDISFMSLLNETAKPDPIVSTATLQPQTFFFENSRDSSIMGKFDVDTLMNESSLDFVAKFADLQALTQEDPMADLTNSKKTISNG